MGEITVDVNFILGKDDMSLLVFPHDDVVVVKTSSPGFGAAINSANLWTNGVRVRAVIGGAKEPEIHQVGLLTENQQAAAEKWISSAFIKFCERGILPPMKFVGVPSEHMRALRKELAISGYPEIAVHSTDDLLREWHLGIYPVRGASPRDSEKINEIVKLVVTACHCPPPKLYTEEAVVARMDSLANCIINSIRTGEGGVAECTITGERWTIPGSIRPKAAKLRAENETLKELLAEANGKLLTIRETL